MIDEEEKNEESLTMVREEAKDKIPSSLLFCRKGKERLKLLRSFWDGANAARDGSTWSTYVKWRNDMT